MDTLRGNLGHDKYLTEGDPQKLEMRAMLADPIGQKYIGQFAKNVMTQVNEKIGLRCLRTYAPIMLSVLMPFCC